MGEKKKPKKKTLFFSPTLENKIKKNELKLYKSSTIHLTTYEKLNFYEEVIVYTYRSYISKTKTFTNQLARGFGLLSHLREDIFRI